jgi:hypothetical protein
MPGLFGKLSAVTASRPSRTTHLDEYRVNQTTPPYSMEFRIWRTLEQPASLVAYSFGLLPSSRSCGIAIHVVPSLPNTSTARKNNPRWSSVRSVTAGSGFVSELACEGVEAFPGDSEWLFIMCALRWNKQVTAPTMTLKRPDAQHKITGRRTSCTQKRIGTVEHRSVAFELCFDITTNQFNDYPDPLMTESADTSS